eukprot:tig00021357_g20760.t1
MTEDMRKIEEWQITAEALKKKHEEDKERKRQEVMERIREREKQRLEEQRIRKEKEEAVLQAIGEGSSHCLLVWKNNLKQEKLQNKKKCVRSSQKCGNDTGPPTMMR